MSFMYNGEERACPIFVPGREQLPCRRWMCLAYSESFDYFKIDEVLEEYKVCFCHALQKELDIEKMEEKKEGPDNEN